MPEESQRLIFKGRVLKDEQTLASYGFEDNQTIHMVRGTASRAVPNAAAVAAGSSVPPPAPAPSSNNPPPRTATNPMANPFSGGMPDINSMQQQLQSNPEMMRSIMNSPMMTQMMSNPELMSSLIQNNPQMQELMSRNPQLSQVLNDPEMMRRSMEMMRNPEAMRQAMRSQELAMSQIENMPGGMDHLRRMYEEVQAPMEEAMAPGAAGGASTGNSSTPAEGTNLNAGLQGTPMPNPWGSTPNPNSSAAPNPAGAGAPANPFAGMGGMGGMGGLPGMTPGTMPDMNTLSSMLDNPMMQQAMQQMAANPQMMQTMLNSNPMMRQMMDANPMMRDMMNNPAALQQMMNPDNMRAMLNMQQAMGSGVGGPGGLGGMFPPPAGAPPPPATPATATINGLDFSNLINSAQNMNVSGGVVPGAPLWPGAPFAAAPQPPRERFARQLASLNDMGFTDEEANIGALTATNGNVNRAVERLLSS